MRCAEAMAEDTTGAYGAAKAGLELGTTKCPWDKLSTSNEGRLPDQNGQNNTSHSKEDLH